MTTSIDQKAYLKKYLSGTTSAHGKTKKKKKVVKGKGFKIIDDDLDVTKIRPLEGDELDILDEGEDGPQVAGIIDDRPEDMKKIEQFQTTSKWRVVNKDDGFNSKLQVEEIKKNVKETQKENELVFGKMYSDSEDEKKDETAPSIQVNKKNAKNIRRKDSDSDMSPPRKDSKKYDSDLSPPRQNSHSVKENRIRKPSRWGKESEPKRERMSRSPSPRTSKHKRKSKSPDSDLEPPRISKHQVKSKNSISNKDRDPSYIKSKAEENNVKKNYENKHKHSSNRSRRRSRQDSTSDDSDISPPRKNRKKSNSPSRKSKKRLPERKRNDSSDLSPPRKERRKQSSGKRRDSSSDLSPLRKEGRNQSSGKNRDSSSDLSPPRKERRTDSKKSYTQSDSPPPSNKKMEKTLEGKKAGLQDAKELREENEAFRKRENDAFRNMTDDVSGRNAKVVSRKGHKRETSEERRKLKEKAERQKELDEKYKKWSKGLKQIEAQESRVQDFLHEAAKPLARHKDDRDLEASLKQIEREGDPMLKYIREKKRERGELGPEKPTYKGKFNPNRFNIRPGYRWDGVDRSNGYEKKYFAQQSKRKAQEEEAYKWSTEDL